MNPYWTTNADAAPGTITLAKLQEAFAMMEERSLIPHGTAQNPHIVSLRTWQFGNGPCHECGEWFPPRVTPRFVEP